MLGIALAAWGAARTRFVMLGDRLHYVPHTYTGIVVSLLFLGRLVFRIFQVYAATHAPHAPGVDASRAFAPAALGSSSLTVGIFFVLAGYYLYYYSWVLWKSKHLDAADIEVPAAAPP
jgi:predicted transporter